MRKKHPLTAYRELKGFSLAELASKARTSRQSLFRIEQGKQVPSLLMISEITRATGGEVTADDLLRAAKPTLDQRVKAAS